MLQDSLSDPEIRTLADQHQGRHEMRRLTSMALFIKLDDTNQGSCLQCKCRRDHTPTYRHPLQQHTALANTFACELPTFKLFEARLYPHQTRAHKHILLSLDTDT